MSGHLLFDPVPDLRSVPRPTPTLQMSESKSPRDRSDSDPNSPLPTLFLNQQPQQNKQQQARGIVPEEFSPSPSPQTSLAESPPIDGVTSGSLSSFMAGPMYKEEVRIAVEAARLKPKSLDISNSPLGKTRSTLRSPKNTIAAWGEGEGSHPDKSPRTQSARSPKTANSMPSRIDMVRGLGAMLTRAASFSKSKKDEKDPAGEATVQRQSSVHKLQSWLKTKPGKVKVAPDDSKTSPGPMNVLTLPSIGQEKDEKTDLPDTPVLAEANTRSEEPATPILILKERVKKATRRLSVIRQMANGDAILRPGEKGKGLKRSDSFNVSTLAPLERELSGVVPFRICIPVAGLRNGWDLMVVLLVIWNLIILPVDLAFDLRTGLGWLAFDTCCDCLFISDIVIQMYTPFYLDNQKKWVTDRRKIRKRYLQSWFLVRSPIDWVCRTTATR